MDKLEISFTEDEYKAFLSRTTVDEDGELNYQELIYSIFPKEPIDYPEYRQEKLELEDKIKKVIKKTK